ncbi:MAG: SUMF1/EgtB/PvdO family nonheme iron enzyme [Anaerolineae bacterium]|nr:SUMF1/EgtB/PvdO family nonheme iron enzyme [Anaerolineae bacterium]
MKAFHKGVLLSLCLLTLPVIVLAACSSPSAVAQPPAAPAAEEAPPVSPTAAEPTQPPPAEPTQPPTAEPSPTPTAEPTEPPPGATRTSPKDGMVQVYVPAGEFIMGSNDPDAKQTEEGGRAYPEIPQFTYSLPGFWIDKYEVSNAQFAKCVADGVCDPPNYTRSYTREWYYGNPEFDNYPVLYVTWFTARKYCEWAGRRLPTEAEWEKAARGTDGRRYPWGNEPPTGELVNFCDINCPKTHANPNYDDGYPETAPVDAFPKGASPYGALNMSGNVWEWTSTLVRPYPYDPNDGRENMDEMSDEHIWRGGPWSNGIWWIRASIRYRSVPVYWYGNLGFRCASSE